MKERIRQIMEARHMTQQEFAQFIEMSPASLSGIFTERTRPTLNTVEAIKKKIPNINTDWLMFGTGDMYVTSDSDTTEPPIHPSDPSEPLLDFGASDLPFSNEATSATSHGEGRRTTHAEVVREEVKYIDKPQRKITEIRIYFDDLTFETFVPSKGK